MSKIIDVLVKSAPVVQMNDGIRFERGPMLGYEDAVLFSKDLDMLPGRKSTIDYLEKGKRLSIHTGTLKFGLLLGYSEGLVGPDSYMVMINVDKDGNETLVKKLSGMGCDLPTELIIKCFYEFESYADFDLINYVVNHTHEAYRHFNLLWNTEGRHFNMQVVDFDDNYYTDSCKVLERFHTLFELIKAKDEFANNPENFSDYPNFNLYTFEDYLIREGKLESLNTSTFDMGTIGCTLDEVRDTRV